MASILQGGCAVTTTLSTQFGLLFVVIFKKTYWNKLGMNKKRTRMNAQTKGSSTYEVGYFSWL